MADDEVATRAPESDAQEALMASDPLNSTQTPAPTPAPAAAPLQHTPAPTPNDMLANDTPAQSGPTMGEHCTSDRPVPSASSQQPMGEISSINNVPAYISKPPSYPHQPGKLLLLLTGGTGIHSINNQLQADMFASRGYVVVMPDQFNKDPAPNTSVSEEDAQAAANEQDPSWLERIKMGAAETAKSFLIDMWLARHTAEKVMPILLKVLEGAKEEFADADANGGGVYGVGYCFGGKYILQLLSDGADAAKAGQKAQGDEESGGLKKSSELKAGVIAHGTLITKEDVESIERPVAMVCVKNDSLFPDDVREQGRAVLELNSVEHDIRLYDDVPHGFAVVGDYKDEQIREKQREAYDFMIEWLEKH